MSLHVGLQQLSIGLSFMSVINYCYRCTSFTGALTEKMAKFESVTPGASFINYA